MMIILFLWAALFVFGTKALVALAWAILIYGFMLVMKSFLDAALK
jgi:hypothetical protein